MSALVGFVAVPLVAGALGMLLGGAYLASSTWQLRVITDDAGLEVGTAKRQRFRLAWSDVVKVVVSEATHTCFVDGGAPGRSLLVPGVGAPAPYDIENRAGLVAVILEHVASENIQRVDTLESVTG